MKNAMKPAVFPAKAGIQKMKHAMKPRLSGEGRNPETTNCLSTSALPHFRTSQGGDFQVPKQTQSAAIDTTYNLSQRSAIQRTNIATVCDTT